MRRASPHVMAYAPEALMPAYYLRTGESVVDSIKSSRESRSLRTGFGRTAIVSSRVAGEGQLLILRQDGTPVVEEWAVWRGLPLEAVMDRLRKAATLEETRSWPEMLIQWRVLSWIEREGFPPIPETTAGRIDTPKLETSGPLAGRPIELMSARTTYVGVLDAGAKLDGIPSELDGQTVEVMDVLLRTFERRHADGRIEQVDVAWQK